MTNHFSISRYRRYFGQLKNRIWSRDLSGAGKLHRFIVTVIRIFLQVSRDIWDGQITLRAMSLVYTTLLSLIPLLAISFSVLKGFGVHREIEPFLIASLAPLGEKAEEIGHQMIMFVENTNVAVLGYAGFALLFYAVVSLLQKIETAFNYVWHITQNRSFVEQIRDYLALVIIGPTLMFTSTGIWASLLGTNVMEEVAGIQPLGWLLQALTGILPVLLIILAFSFIYVFVPNAKVRWLPALAGGIVAGILWSVGGVGFALFVGSSAKYPAIYSSFATAIFFMIWVYLSWMILLIGGSISFYMQNPAAMAPIRRTLTLSNRTKEKLALAIAAAIGQRFYSREKPHTSISLAEQLGLPVSAVDYVLGALRAGGLLVRAGDETACFVPAQSWDTLSVGDLLGCMRAHGEHSDLNPDHLTDPAIADIWTTVDQATSAASSEVTLRDLSLDPSPCDDSVSLKS